MRFAQKPIVRARSRFDARSELSDPTHPGRRPTGSRPTEKWLFGSQLTRSPWPRLAIGGVLALAMTHGPWCPAQMCTLYDSLTPPALVQTYWQNSNITNVYETVVSFKPVPVPTPPWYNPSIAYLFKTSGNYKYLHQFTGAEIKSGSKLITFELPCWIPNGCSVSGGTISFAPGSSFEAQLVVAQPDMPCPTYTPCGIPAAWPVAIPSFIVTQPTNQMVCTGLPATLSVATAPPSGAPTPAYEWQRLDTVSMKWVFQGTKAAMLVSDVPGSYRAKCIYDPEHGDSPLMVEYTAVAVLSPAPAAGVVQAGQGCAGVGSQPPVLSSSPPLVGTTFVLSVTQGPPSSTGLLLASAVPAAGGVGTQLAGGCLVYVDPTTLLTLPLALDASGGWQLPITLPADNSLLGLKVELQVGCKAAAGLQGIVLSNSLELTFGC